MFRLFRSFDWRTSKAHLLLLSKFIHGQELNYLAKWGNWEKVLGESPEKAIKRFIDEGVLVKADLNTLVSYKYKVVELKNLLKQRKLNLTGAKEDLVKRLTDIDKEGMSSLVAGIELLTYTERGRAIAEKFLNSEKEKRLQVEQQVMGYLAKRMFSEASLSVANYEAEQVFSRGMGIDWKHYNPKREIEILTSIFDNKPEVLSKLEDVKLEPLRMGAAMMELWGENTASKWLPLNFEAGLSIDNDTAARMLVFDSQHKESLKQYRESGVVQYVEILATPNSCESCKKLQGKRYKLS